MRTEVLNYLKTLSLGSFNVTEELPREESGAALYLKNPKRIYADNSQFEEVPAIKTFNSNNVNNYTETVSVYFTVDAKLLPSNYSTIVNGIQAAKDIATSEGFNNRQASVQTEFVNDLMVTQVDISYSKLR